jgi:hypothetical protein
VWTEPTIYGKPITVSGTIQLAFVHLRQRNKLRKMMFGRDPEHFFGLLERALKLSAPDEY